MKKNKNEIIKVDIYDVLTDENNTDPIYMYNDRGEQIEFEQIAVIPCDDDLYCVLKPVTKLQGVAPDEAVAFKVERDENGESFLKVVEDELIAISVFDKYYDLVLNDMEGE